MTNLAYQHVHHTTIGDICSTIDYGHTASAAPLKDGPRFLRITDIQNARVDWPAVPGCEISATEEIASGLTDGDIVFARTGATTGKSFLIQSPPRAVFASYLIRLRLDRAQTMPRYVYLFFQSERYWEQLREFARGAAQPNVNATLLGKIKIPLPPLAEQERIAARLTEQLAAVKSAAPPPKAASQPPKRCPPPTYGKPSRDRRKANGLRKSWEMALSPSKRVQALLHWTALPEHPNGES